MKSYNYLKYYVEYCKMAHQWCKVTKYAYSSTVVKSDFEVYLILANTYR